ncbi:MAG: aminotransferase class V-fold PLP-dependent enzyme [Polyangiaceae bacterium]
MDSSQRTALRLEYKAFLGRSDRVLLTGHSHQAWPDAARDAGARAFDDAATFVDDKWQARIFPLVESVGSRILDRLGFDRADGITFGANTHELVYRVLSALPLGARVVTTTSEFHSLHRQLSRLGETDLEVEWVDARPRESLASRILTALEGRRTDLLALSAVLFEDAWIVAELGEIASRAVDLGVTVLVDAYHAFNVVPLDWGPARDALFVTAGGYKYAQLGEGVCFLRVPSKTELRPRFTGWFADFAALEEPRVFDGGRPAQVRYGAGGARFAGSTFDATSLYRASAVLDVFDRHGLDVPTLRAESIRQTSLITDSLQRAGLQLASSEESARRAGFVSVRLKNAEHVVRALRERQVYVDARGELLRLGPAPYLEDDEILRAVAELVRVVASHPR